MILWLYVLRCTIVHPSAVADESLYIGYSLSDCKLERLYQWFCLFDVRSMWFCVVQRAGMPCYIGIY